MVDTLTSEEAKAAAELTETRQQHLHELKLLIRSKAPKNMPPRQSLSAAMHTINTMIDNAQAELWNLHHKAVAASGRTPLKLACKKHCAACCTYLVSCTDLEAMYIAQVVSGTHPKRKRKELIAKLEAWDAEWQLFAHEYREHHGPIDTSKSERRCGMLWGFKHRACPFLDTGNNTNTRHTCTIYNDRPVHCRTHHAVYPPDYADANADGRMPRIPGEGCYVTPEDVKLDSSPPLWILEPDLGVAASSMLMKMGAQAGVPMPISLTDLKLEPMPSMILRYGRANHGW